MSKNKASLTIYVLIAITVLGCAISIYSIDHHFEVLRSGQTDAACNINESLSCDEVAKSEYSEIFGIPLGFFGLGFFLSLALCYLSLFVLPLQGLFGVKTNEGASSKNPYINTATIILWLGVIACSVLAFISLSKIGTMCPTCIGVYASTGLLFILHIIFTKSVLPHIKKQTLQILGTCAVVVVASSIIGRNIKPEASKPPAVNQSQITDSPMTPKVQKIEISL